MSEQRCHCPGKAVLVLLEVLGERCPGEIEKIRKLLREAKILSPLAGHISKDGVEALDQLLESLTRGSEGDLAT